MSDPERALQGAILQRLRAEPALQALVGARVWDQPPAEATHPYVVFGRAETRPVNADGGGFEHRLSLNCVSRYGGAEEAKTVVGRVRACLDGAALAPAGWRCVDLRVTYVEVFRSVDLRTTYGVVRVRAVVEAA
jgi:hypothetical protein